MSIRKGELLTGAVAGATVFGAIRMSLKSHVPTIGPVSAPIAIAIVGLAVLAFAHVDGIAGDIVDGVGFGLVAYGVASL